MKWRQGECKCGKANGKAARRMEMRQGECKCGKANGKGAAASARERPRVHRGPCDGLQNSELHFSSKEKQLGYRGMQRSNGAGCAAHQTM
jgi:hypothetical protein